MPQRPQLHVRRLSDRSLVASVDGGEIQSERQLERAIRDAVHQMEHGLYIDVSDVLEALLEQKSS